MLSEHEDVCFMEQEGEFVRCFNPPCSGLYTGEMFQLCFEAIEIFNISFEGTQNRQLYGTNIICTEVRRLKAHRIGNCMVPTLSVQK